MIIVAYQFSSTKNYYSVSGMEILLIGTNNKKRYVPNAQRIETLKKKKNTEVINKTEESMNESIHKTGTLRGFWNSY